MRADYQVAASTVIPSMGQEIFRISLTEAKQLSMATFKSGTKTKVTKKFTAFATRRMEDFRNPNLGTYHGCWKGDAGESLLVSRSIRRDRWCQDSLTWSY